MKKKKQLLKIRNILCDNESLLCIFTALTMLISLSGGDKDDFKPKKDDKVINQVDDASLNEIIYNYQDNVYDNISVLDNNLDEELALNINTKIKQQILDKPLSIEFSISIEDKINHIITYCNLDSKEALSSFINYFLEINVFSCEEDIINWLYHISLISCEDKIAKIMEDRGLTYEQVDTTIACAVAEGAGGGDKYIDVYAVASTISNRTRSKKWNDYISYLYGENARDNIYYQTIASGQFSVYALGSYRAFLGNSSLVGYQAAVDMFYSGISMHNKLSFLAAWCQVYDSCQYVAFGNHYYDDLLQEDMIIEDTKNYIRILTPKGKDFSIK